MRFRDIIKDAQVRNWSYRQAVRFLVRPLVSVRRPHIVAVTGTNGKTTVCKMLDRIFRTQGYRTGCATTDGATLDGKLLDPGDNAGGNGLWRILRRARPDLLIAETSRGGILRHGIGFGRCDTAAVLNVFDDHLGEEGVDTVNDMARVKARLVPLGRSVVLNADDALVRGMESRASNGIFYYTTGEPHFDRGIFVRGDTFWIKSGRGEEALLGVREARITEGGLLDFEVQNVAAALAIVESLQDVLPVSRDALAEALAGFGRDPLENPGRHTLLRCGNALVFLLRSKNAEGAQRSARLVRLVRERYRVRRVIGLLTGTGGTRPQQIRDASRIIAGACDLVAIGAPHARFTEHRPTADLLADLASNVAIEKQLPDGNRSLDELMRDHAGRDGETLFAAFDAIDDARVDLRKFLREGTILPMGGPTG